MLLFSELSKVLKMFDFNGASPGFFRTHTFSSRQPGLSPLLNYFQKLQAAFPPFSGKAACPFQNKRFAFWCSLVVRNVLLADSDDLNLAQQLLGQLLHGHAGTSGLAGEILAVHAVESSEVFHVSQEAGGLDDVLEAQAVSSQNGLDALAGALSLLLDAVPTISPVPGIRGTWPEANRKPLAEIA